jgi:hypothetical protein
MSQPGNPSTEELRRRGKLARKVSPWGRYAACKTKRALESARKHNTDAEKERKP